MTEDQEEEKKDLNKSKPDINRGVELLLRNRRKPEIPKTFQVKFGKLIVNSFVLPSPDAIIVS